MKRGKSHFKKNENLKQSTMKEENNCPVCNYPMESKLKRTARPYRAKVEYWDCPCCKHRERTPSVAESAKLEDEQNSTYINTISFSRNQ